MTAYSFTVLLLSFATNADIQGRQESDWLCLLLPTAGVALVSGIFNCIDSRRMKRLEAKLGHQGEFFSRKLAAHEKLWPVLAECNRAQMTLSRRKGKGVDLKPFADKIKECRAQMKNFVFDHGLYFDQHIRDLVQELDAQLEDPDTADVHTKVEELETELRRIVNEMA